MAEEQSKMTERERLRASYRCDLVCALIQAGNPIGTGPDHRVKCNIKRWVDFIEEGDS